MKSIFLYTTVLCCLLKSIVAFAPAPFRFSVPSPLHGSHPCESTLRFAQRPSSAEDETGSLEVQFRQASKAFTSGLAGLAIFASTWLGGFEALQTPSDFAVPQAQAAEPTSKVVEVSNGAVVVQTSQTASASLLKSTVDSKSIIKTLFTKRQALSSSLGRMKTAISNEFATEPAWKDLQKEILSIEGDLADVVRVTPPSDWRETIRDLSAGKFNLLINGEVVNVAVVPTFGEKEDIIMIEVRGFKGDSEDLIRFLPKPASSAPSYGPIRTYLARFDSFWTWWNSPLPQQYQLPNLELTKGEVVLTGTAGSIVAIYSSAYAFYVSEQEEAEAAAEAKRLEKKQKADLKKAKAAAAAKEAKEQKGTSSDEKSEESTASSEETPKGQTDRRRRRAFADNSNLPHWSRSRSAVLVDTFRLGLYFIAQIMLSSVARKAIRPLVSRTAVRTFSSELSPGENVVVPLISQTLEFTLSSPPPLHQFDEPPLVVETEHLDLAPGKEVEEILEAQGHAVTDIVGKEKWVLNDPAKYEGLIPQNADWTEFVDEKTGEWVYLDEYGDRVEKP